ncbi:RidA family protein [Nocardia sp. 2YAB30]|uniref:RidA family protein n=1 Tax=Nocardia sp. 2YAB30 TaxID=3233022 RepID=UPI003F9AB8BE
MTRWEKNLAELGLTLPPVVAPVAAYIPAIRTGSLVYTSGQLPFVDGELSAVGKVGAEVSIEAAKEAARLCALNALAAVHDLVGLDAVVRIVKVVGFVASGPMWLCWVVVVVLGVCRFWVSCDGAAGGGFVVDVAAVRA